MKILMVAMCCLLIALPCKPAGAAALPLNGTFIYSDACASDGGDFEGFRVTLIRAHGITQTIVEFNDDGPDGRGEGRDVKFDPVDGELSFSFRGSVGGEHMFRGVVSRDRLTGMFDTVSVTLPAVHTAPKELPDC